MNGYLRALVIKAYCIGQLFLLGFASCKRVVFVPAPDQFIATMLM